MSYSNFDLVSVKKAFNLAEETTELFGAIEEVSPSEWLTTSLKIGVRLTQYSQSEKAKSELIVMPILVELQQRNSPNIALYSGKSLDVDKEKELNGECDFIVSKGHLAYTIQTPIIGLVEAKRNDIELGMGQCVAQMVGALLFNELEGHPVEQVFGCVTTGEIWQFLKLAQDTIWVNERRYYINHVETILGVFQQIVELYQ